MNENPPLSAHDRKVMAVFEHKFDRVIHKSLANNVAFQGLPRYVSECLLASQVKPETLSRDLQNLRLKLNELLPTSENLRYLENQLFKNKELILIDRLECSVDLKAGRHSAMLERFGAGKRFGIRSNLIDQHEGVLYGGLWGTLKLIYDPEDTQAVQVSEFHPFQIKGPTSYKSLYAVDQSFPRRNGYHY